MSPLRLNDYIHKPENQLNDESRIFEAIAEEHLNYPLLRLRNMHAEIRYLEGVENSEEIEIEIKKKDQDPHLLRQISLIPYIKTKNGPLYLCESPYKSFKYFKFPSTHLIYSDIPTLKNKHGEDVIDLASFYKDFKEYLLIISNNAIDRLFKTELKAKISDYNVINRLKPKVYEPFYNSITNSLAILVECKADENLVIDDYRFQQILPNSFSEYFDEILMDKIRNVVGDSQKIIETFLENPLNIQVPDVKKCFSNHQDISSKEKASFYAEMVDAARSEGEEVYTKTVDRVPDKELLEVGSEMKVLLSIQECKDAVNCTDKLFHIDPLVRELWKHVSSKVEESQ